MALASPLALVLVVLPAPGVADLPPPMHVRVDRLVRMLPPHSTVAEARRILPLRPRPGDLLDVEGIVLEPRRYPGHILVNGEPRDDRYVLAPGDVLEVADERDRFEPVTVETNQIAEGMVQNPQTHLGTTPGEQVITAGALSGKLVSSLFRPLGAADVPTAVALTFDDGPSPTFTPRIVRILRDLEVPATFFMVGYLAERYPDMVRLVVDAGMVVGNHSMGHPNSPPFAELPRRQARQQVERGHHALERLGAAPSLFRPPGGSWSAEVVDAAAELGERVVLWSVDSRDYDRRKPRALARRVVRDAEPGSIILMHDGGGDRSVTLKALPRIIRGLRAKGLSFETP